MFWFGQYVVNISILFFFFAVYSEKYLFADVYVYFFFFVLLLQIHYHLDTYSGGIVFADIGN